MQAIRSILVVIEPDQLEGLALKRAQLIAGVTQSHLHLLVCEKRRDHSAALNDLAQEPARGRLQRLDQPGLEGLPAPDHHRRATGRRLRADHQAALSRQPAEKGHPHPGRLEAAALRALSGTDDQDRPALDGRKDPRRGRRRQQRRRAPLPARRDHQPCLRHRRPGQGHAARDQRPPLADALLRRPDLPASETIEARYREACRTFQAEYGFSDEQLHIEEGPADVLIPRTAQKLDAVVTVIGTVARTGLSGALIGNTAEVVLDTLESDVLVLKPDDIIAHLEELASKE